MRTLRIRGLVGSIISLCAGLLGIAFLFLPMLVETNGNVIYSVFGSILKVNEIGKLFGGEGIMYVASVAMMIVFTLISFALIALSISTLIGVCNKKYNLSMAIAMRVLSLFAAIVASIATTLLLLYFSLNSFTATTFGVGPIISIAVALIGVAGAFVLPSAGRFAKTMKQNDRLSNEGKAL